MSFYFLKSNKLIALKSMNLLSKVVFFFFWGWWGGMDHCKNELKEHFLFLNLKDYIYEYTDHASIEFHLRKNLGLGSHKGSGLPGETHMWPSTLSE